MTLVLPQVNSEKVDLIVHGKMIKYYGLSSVVQLELTASGTRLSEKIICL